MNRNRDYVKVENFLLDNDIFTVDSDNSYLMEFYIDGGNWELKDDIYLMSDIIDRINKHEDLKVTPDLINMIMKNNEMDSLINFIETINEDRVTVHGYEDFIYYRIIEEYDYSSMGFKRFFFDYIDKDEEIQEKIISKYVEKQTDRYYLDTYEKLIVEML